MHLLPSPPRHADLRAHPHPHRVCVLLRRWRAPLAAAADDDDGELLLCTPDSLGALVQRVRAHCRLRIGARGAAAAHHRNVSITVFDADGARLDAAAFANLVRTRRAAAWALTHVEVRVVMVVVAAP